MPGVRDRLLLSGLKGHHILADRRHIASGAVAIRETQSTPSSRGGSTPEDRATDEWHSQEGVNGGVCGQGRRLSLACANARGESKSPYNYFSHFRAKAQDGFCRLRVS